MEKNPFKCATGEMTEGGCRVQRFSRKSAHFTVNHKLHFLSSFASKFPFAPVLSHHIQIRATGRHEGSNEKFPKKHSL